MDLRWTGVFCVTVVATAFLMSWRERVERTIALPVERTIALPKRHGGPSTRHERTVNTSAPAAPSTLPRLVWVSGLPRAGTDWLAAVLGSALTGRTEACKQYPRRCITHVALREPFNPDNVFVCRGHRAAELRSGPYAGHYVWLDPEDPRATAAIYEASVRKMISACAGAMEGPGHLMVAKDPVAFFSTPWMAARFHVENVVVMLRNPLTWIASMVKRAYVADHLDCKSSTKCSWLRMMDAFETDHMPHLRRAAMDRVALNARVAALEHAIRRARDKRRHLDGLKVVYGMFLTVATLYKAEHPLWCVLRWEDLVTRPQRSWHHVAQYVGLQDRLHLVGDVLTVTTGGGGEENSFTVQRDSWVELHDWQEELTADQEDDILATTAVFYRAFYPEVW